MSDVADLEKWKAGGHGPQRREEVYRWPLDLTVTAELRFIGGSVTARHIQHTIELLAIMQRGLEGSSEPIKQKAAGRQRQRKRAT